jgi:ketosteroid isomerase-like protein
MRPLDTLKKIAVEYVTQIGTCGAQPRHLAAQATAWSIRSKAMTRAVYVGKLALIKDIFKVPLTFSIESVTAEGDRVAIMASSTGTLFNDRVYTNDYMFLLVFDPEGEISHLREYYDQRRADEILTPAFQQWAAGR